MVLILLIGMVEPNQANAEYEFEDDSTATIKNSDNEVVCTITMIKGVITIEAKAHAGTTSIRWETIGLTITKEAVDEDGAYTKDRYGPEAVSSVYDSGHAVLWFDEAAYKEDSDPVNGIITTTIRFSEEQVTDALQEDFSDISKDTIIYLHAIFDTFNYDVASGKKLSIREGERTGEDGGGLTTWKGIMDAEWWGNDTLDDFSKYFNMPIKFKPAKQPNTMHYISEDGQYWDAEKKCYKGDVNWDSEELEKELPGELVIWSNEPTELDKPKKTYRVIGYFITRKGKEEIKRERYLKNGEIGNVDNLVSGSCTERLGGMDIYLVYKEEKTIITPTPTPTPTPKISKIPTPTPKITATPTPKVAPKPTPTPVLEEDVVPKADSEYMAFTKVESTGILRADDRGSEKFTVTEGIPTTESLFGQVTATEYLLGYKFVKKVGIKYYSVKVSKDYILNWKSATPKEKGGGKPLTDTVTVTQYISVPRAYGYWEIQKLEYYTIDQAELNNYALPNGELILAPNSKYYSPSSISYSHTSSEDYHIIAPDEVSTGIKLPSETLTGDINKPTVPTADFKYYALSQTGKIKVKSDSLTFNGNTVISSTITETDAPGLNISAIPQCTTKTNKDALYKNDQVIEATKKNGLYGSTGILTYKAVAQVGTSMGANINYSINGINDIVIHTPVICDPIVNADNEKYVQLVNPTEKCVELVLDPDPTLSDFTVKISNTEFHTGIAGYFTRDFSYSLHDTVASYIAEKNGLLRNEVKFPFDVFVDVGSDNNQDNDDYIKAGTWITLGRATARFYLPAWTTEGVYTVNFRTVSVNGENDLHDTEVFANRNRANYVATNTVKMEVSGRIYGLTLYDISDYPIWEEAFRMPLTDDLKINSSDYTDGTDKKTYSKNYSYNYTVGTNDQYGIDTGRNIKYTFPLVNGSHPNYKNQGILKTGYMIRFSLDTIGSMFSDGTSVVIKPSFYYVDAKGENRTAVDLYYTEEINGKSKNLVKVGGTLDSTNIKSFHTGDLNLSIPRDELVLTAALRNMKYEKFFWQQSAMFTFSRIQLNYTFRTLVGQDYADSVISMNCFSDTTDNKTLVNNAEKSMQRWYGQYYIPNEVHVVKKDFDVMDYADKHGVDYDEDFWLTEGYIIVNLNIYTIDESGKKHLSYINASNYKNNGNCSMWMMEGPPFSKDSNKGPTFHFYAGDFFIYYANKKGSKDYSGGAIY